MRRRPSHEDLLARCRFPDDPRSAAIACCLAQALEEGRQPLVRGLAEDEFRQMLRSCFEGVALRNGSAPRQADGAVDEFDDLLALLLAQRAEATPINAWLSCCIASASLSDRHLWQDMGLPDRPALSRLLRAIYPALAARNVGDMKWKKFFYRQLCERAGLRLCKSPNCGACSDYAACFGPEIPAAEDARRRLEPRRR
jgi:nitrogen fixation protein NifQ